MNWSWPSFVAGILASYILCLGVLGAIYFREIWRPKRGAKVLPFAKRAP